MIQKSLVKSSLGLVISLFIFGLCRINAGAGQWQATSSSKQNEERSASLAIDGDLTTRWASELGKDPQWISIDLRENLLIDKVVLHWQAAYASAYRIEVSNDNLSWTRVFQTNIGDGSVDTITFPPLKVRYVRIFGLKRGAPPEEVPYWGYSLFEIEVLEPGQPRRLFPPPPVRKTEIAKTEESVTVVEKGASESEKKAKAEVELTDMEKKIEQPVSLHVTDANLANILLFLAETTGINIISDQEILVDKKVTIRVDDIPLRELLDYISRNLGVAYHVGENTIWVTTPEQVNLETRIYPLSKGLATTGESESEGEETTLTDIENALEKSVPWPEGSKFFLDKKTNTLIVINTVENLKKADKIIRTLDITPLQILIQTRFVEAGVDDLRQLGIDWGLTSPWDITRDGEKGKLEISTGAGTEFLPFSSRGAEGLNITLAGVLTHPQFEMVINALEETGKSNTLSAPQVTTLNNQKATIEIVDEFPYFKDYQATEVQTGVDSDGDPIYSTVFVPANLQIKNLGIILEVTPSVGADRQDITLVLAPSVTAFVRFEEYGGVTGTGGEVTQKVKQPVFSNQSVVTNIVVHSGETVVMGGLMKETKVKTLTKVPLLGSIPLLGRLFRKESDSIEKSTLYIFVTAHLLTPRGEEI